MANTDMDFKKIRQQSSGRRIRPAAAVVTQQAPAPKTDGTTIVATHSLTKSYKMGKIKLEVLKGIDLQINSGQFTAIIGASGSGKSTLLHIIGGLDKPDSGSVEFENFNLAAMSAKQMNLFRNKKIGFVFQFYHLLQELTVLENVFLPAMASCSSLGWIVKSAKAKKHAKELLEMVGLADRAKQKSYQLSGGERQRVAIARALMNSPKLLLADEPTGNLDSKTGYEILRIFENLKKAGQTTIMVTHDNSIAQKADKIIRLVDGKII